MSIDYIKKPCQHCPFRNDVKPFLHPDRAYEIAIGAENPYSDFSCHKTTEHDDDEGNAYYTGKEKTCAGFLTIRANALGEESLPEGFEPSWEICYSDSYEMQWAYEEEWDKERTG